MSGAAWRALLGRAAWRADRRQPSYFCCLWSHGCSGRRRARPPARSPHASLRLGVVDLEARPCPPDPPAPVTPVALVVLCALARPRRPRGGLQSGSAYRCERPGIAAARGHCCQALGGSLAGVNRAVIAVPRPSLVSRETRVKRRGRAERAPGLDPTCLDPEALDDLRSRERGKDLARHKELRTTQTRADAAPARRARRIDEESP